MASDAAQPMSTAVAFMSTPNSSLPNDVDNEPLIPHSLAWLIIVGIIYCLIIVITLVGNAFVMAAYAVDIKIRSRPSNLLILNLAISDFFVGITLIFNFLFLVFDAWILGEIPCKLWTVLDYSCSFMSVITITLISLDRYWMVKKKLGYRTHQTKKRILITLFICWSIVISFYTITAFGYGAMTNTNHVDFSHDCEMEYLYDIPFSATMIVVEFVIPFFVILYLNLVVYLNVRMRAGALVRSKTNKDTNPISKSSTDINKSFGTDSASGLAFSENLFSKSSPIVTISYATVKSVPVSHHGFKSSYLPTEGVEIDESFEESKASDEGIVEGDDEKVMSNGFTNPTLENKDTTGESDEQGEQGRNSSINAKLSTSESQHANGDAENKVEIRDENLNNNANGSAITLNTTNEASKNGKKEKEDNKLKVQETRLLSGSATTLTSVSFSVDGDSNATLGRRGRQNLEKKSKEFRRQRRAAIVLFTLVVAFTICWMPYQITTIIMTIMGDHAIPEMVAEIMTNLLWCNSTINPFLYAVVTVSFRRNFLRFLGLERVSCSRKRGANSSDGVKDRVNTSDPTTADS